jgi:ubiquinone biosynthesis protein
MFKWRNIILEIHRSLVVTVSALRLATLSIFDMTSHRVDARPRMAMRLRKVLENLGPTFVKFGQFLAVRFDLLPVEFCYELNNLFENVRKLKYEEIRDMIESELNAPMAKLFSELDPVPIASASMAQVHEARTIAGERVAVKVQRPNIGRLLRTDLRIMQRLAVLCDALRLFGALELANVVAEFMTYTERELDFSREGSTADILRRGATQNEIIPRVYWELTTTRVLTVEFIEGVSLAEIADRVKTGDRAGIRARLPEISIELVLHRLAHTFLHQMFVVGRFHADPHPGNILVCRGNKIALVDFGIAGELNPRERGLLAGFMENLAFGNYEESYQSYSQLFSPTEDTDMVAFRRDTLQLMRQWHRLSKDPHIPAELRMAGRFADRMSFIVRRHHMRMSMDTLLFWRTLVILDSSTLRFAAQFDMLSELHQFFVTIRSQDFYSNWIRPPSVERVAEHVTIASRTLYNTDVLSQRVASSTRHGRVLLGTEYERERRNSRQLKRMLSIFIASFGVIGLSVLVADRTVVVAAAVIALLLMFYLTVRLHWR